MSWPGWDSITGAEWWANVWFWISIGSLLLLGVSEVVSHVYTLRKDGLAAIAEIDKQKQHDDEMARVHLATAEANARAAEAQLALEKYKAPRSLADAQIATIANKLRPFAGQKYEITTFWEMKEPLDFANRIHNALLGAGWEYVKPDTGHFLLGGIEGVEVWVHPAADKPVMDAANALVAALEAEGVIMARIKQQNPQNPKSDMIGLNVGTKPQ